MTSGGNCARVWLLRFPVQVGKLTQSQLSQTLKEAVQKFFGGRKIRCVVFLPKVNGKPDTARVCPVNMKLAAVSLA